jgi:hypothetical protein
VALLEHGKKNDIRWAIASGIAAGAMILTQPAAAMFLPLAFFALKPRFATSKQWLRASIIAAASAIAIMLPWWIRNAIAMHAFIPLTTSSGLALWQGAHPAGGMIYQPKPAAWMKISELEEARQASAAAWHIIWSDPAGYIQRCLAKLPTSFFMTNWAVDQLVFAPGQPYPSLARSTALRIGPAIAEGAIIIYAMLGMIRSPRSIPGRLLIACLAQIMLFGIWFEFSERHRSFMMPFILLMAATLFFSNSTKQELDHER